MPAEPRYAYVSTRASIDPVKTVIVFPPADDARTLEDAERFARSSGWVDAVEKDAAVLMVAVAPQGWGACPRDLPLRLYQENRRSFKAVSGGSAAAGGLLWAWETLIYLVGYGDGATFAGDFVMACPGFAAASVLVDGSPQGVAALDEPSCHWLVPNPTDYDVRNCDVPVSVWLMGTGDGTSLWKHAVTVDGANVVREATCVGYPTTIYENPDNAGMQVRETLGLTGTDPVIADVAMDFFCRIIRWKNGPDGTLALRRTKAEFFSDGRYLHHEVEHEGELYHYAVYLPEGRDVSAARDLPLVLSVHGRGEPTWIFSGKNGWEDLADETGAFAVLLPDSPGNVWSYERDEGALREIVARALADYGFDAARVYLTGFSNGAVFTCQMASSHPELFAAASPWNGPCLDAIRSSGLGEFVFNPSFASAGYEMPLWICAGDSDDKAGELGADELACALAANGCDSSTASRWDADEHYAPKAGYLEGERLLTTTYANAAGTVLVGSTLVRNMPHGAISDEARAAWEFMRCFRRPDGARHVEVV